MKVIFFFWGELIGGLSVNPALPTRSGWLWRASALLSSLRVVTHLTWFFPHTVVGLGVHRPMRFPLEVLVSFLVLHCRQFNRSLLGHLATVSQRENGHPAGYAIAVASTSKRMQGDQDKLVWCANKQHLLLLGESHNHTIPQFNPSVSAHESTESRSRQKQAKSPKMSANGGTATVVRVQPSLGLRRLVIQVRSATLPRMSQLQQPMNAESLAPMSHARSASMEESPW